MTVRDVITRLTLIPMDDELKLRFALGENSVDLEIGEILRANEPGRPGRWPHSVIEAGEQPSVKLTLEAE